MSPAASGASESTWKILLSRHPGCPNFRANHYLCGSISNSIQVDATGKARSSIRRNAFQLGEALIKAITCSK